MNWLIGCSGFHYKHWRDLFYPEGLPQKKWFEFYSEHFNTLELNVTFYRFPRLNVLQEWHKRSPADFRFSVKAPRAITHYKKFKAVESMLHDFYRVVGEGLGKKIGCVLFQLPPRFSYTDERLDRIIDSLDPAYNNVLEFRETSWWTPEVYRKLVDNKIVFCGMSYPGFPEDFVKAYKVLYYRFHGIPERYKSKYRDEYLRFFADKVADQSKIKTAYIYFNNDIGGSAIENAKAMKQYLSA